MMVGHGALAFALAAGAAVAVGLGRERALLFGAVAGAFGLVPDADIGYAVVGLFANGGFDPGELPDVFWETGNIVHRGLTHSLVVGAVGALLFGLLARRGPLRAVAAAGLAGTVALTLAFPGLLEAGVMVSFLLAGAAVALGARWLGLGPFGVAGAALVGLLSHPFGDVFTGTSPTLFYPLDLAVLPERVLLSSDPTLHLLGAFGTELVALWLAVVVYFLVRDRPLRAHLHRRAALGTSYAGAVVLLPLPTLAVSYQFVFGVLAVGAVVTLAGLPALDRRSPRTWHALVVTGLATVTVAWLAYLLAYLLVG
jgi:membrane-bound metal-dependent hydrolase YbcI (DUF457 family)